MNLFLNLYIVSLLYPSQAFAISEQNISKFAKASVFPHQQTTCKNYGGFWKGQCVDEDGVTRTDSIRFHQKSCDDLQLEVGEDKLTLNGTLVSEKRSRDSEIRIDRFLGWTVEMNLVYAGTFSIGMDRMNHRLIGSFRTIFLLNENSLKSQINTNSRELSTIGQESSFEETCTYMRQT
jgi:hypothetical protein